MIYKDRISDFNGFLFDLKLNFELNCSFKIHFIHFYARMLNVPVLSTYLSTYVFRLLVSL